MIYIVYKMLMFKMLNINECTFFGVFGGLASIMSLQF